MIRGTYPSDREWADSFEDQIKTIITDVSDEIIEIVVAPEQYDVEAATDYIIKIKGGTIACRVRQFFYFEKYRDFTLRYARTSGTKTECEKIKEGYADWYLYCWGDKPKISFYVLINLRALRDNWWVVDNAPIIPNTDNATFFKAISLDTIQQIGALVKANFELPSVPAQTKLW